MKIKNLLILALTIVACQSEQRQLQQRIATAEAALQDSLQEASADALFKLYEDYRRQFPEDQANNRQYLRHAAQWQLQLGRPYEAGLAYLLYIEKYADAAASEDTLFSAALNALRRKVFNETSNRLDDQAANDFLELAETYSSLRPRDPQTPDLLFQAADVAGALRDYERSLAYFEQINTEYPNYQRAPQALFMRAFILDAELRRFKEAEALYKQFLKKYPNDELAQSAKFSLENLGKSEEQIIQEFVWRQERSK